MLLAVIAADPQSLHGAAHELLAKTYYALPDMVGGDLDLAIEMMREAWKRAPDNPRYARLLAGYLLDVEKTEEARSILEQILTMKMDKGGLQLMADQLRVAADLATRMGVIDLSQQLSGQRDDLLENNSFLQKRTVVSAMGHFGDKDPMQDQNAAASTGQSDIDD